MNIGFLPVRCGSKSIPFKNIKSFCGRPLVYWNIKALNDSGLIDEIHVATDCREIIEVVKSFKIPNVHVFERSLENASDMASTESVLLEFLRAKSFRSDDNIILAQATSPLTSAEDIRNAFCKYEDDNADSLLSCVRLKRFFWDDNGNAQNYDIKERPRRQDFRGSLVENGAFYISKVNLIIGNSNRLSGKIAIYEMPEYTFFELDEPDDWSYSEFLMKKYLLKTRRTIKLFLSDVDGTLTDSGMYYDLNGNEQKKFNTRDGKGFEMLRMNGIKTGIITSEKTAIVERRAKKLKIDYLYQGIEHLGKLDVAIEICKKENIELSEVAYIGDDINCKELLEQVGFAACPRDASDLVLNIANIQVLSRDGGCGAVREFVEIILNN